MQDWEAAKGGGGWDKGSAPLNSSEGFSPEREVARGESKRGGKEGAQGAVVRWRVAWPPQCTPAPRLCPSCSKTHFNHADIARRGTPKPPSHISRRVSSPG